MIDAHYMILTAMAICSCRGEALDRGAKRAPTPSSPQDATMASTTLSCDGHTTTIAGKAAEISFDVIDGAAVGEGDIGSFHYVSQTQAPVQIDVWIGQDMSLAWWRGRFGSRSPTLGPESAVTLCGRP